MADNNTIARPYARAVFDVARESAALDGMSAALDTAAELLADGRVAKFLRTPSLSDEQRLAFLHGLFARAMGEDSVFAGGNEHGSNFLKLLVEYDRVDALPEIAVHFNALKDAVDNTIDVTVTSAAPLSDRDKQQYAAALEKRFGRKVELETEIDENLIGGAVMRAGDVVIDGSLRARLNSLATALVN